MRKRRMAEQKAKDKVKNLGGRSGLSGLDYEGWCRVDGRGVNSGVRIDLDGGIKDVLEKRKKLSASSHC